MCAMMGSAKIYFGRVILAVGLVVLTLFLIPKKSESTVYVYRLTNELDRLDDFPYEILGGGVMTLELNGEPAKSLLIRTNLAPSDAVTRLYQSQESTNFGTHRHNYGVMGNDDAAVYMDVSPEKFVYNFSSLLGEDLSSEKRPDSYGPALVVSAHRDASGQGSVVNFLSFEDGADLEKVFLEIGSTEIGFLEDGKKYGEFNVSAISGVSVDHLVFQYTEDAARDGMVLELRDRHDYTTALHFSGDHKTRDVFITDTADGKLAVVVQDRNSMGLEN